MNAIALNIKNISVRQDSAGRYCLNDLHRASGGESKHQPSLFVRREETKQLVSELSSTDSQSLNPIEVVIGKGKNQGTYVVKELVYAYAMWISAKFHIAVIRAYDSLVNQPQYGLKELSAIPSPRAKRHVKGGLELLQQDAINDFIKTRLQSVPQSRRAAMALRIYSAINSKFGVTGTKQGYKNIAPEHFDNIMQLIARIPLEGDNLLTFTEEDFNALVAEKFKSVEGELMEKSGDTASVHLTLNIGHYTESARQRYLITAIPHMVTVVPVDEKESVLSRRCLLR